MLLPRSQGGRKTPEISFAAASQLSQSQHMLPSIIREEKISSSRHQPQSRHRAVTCRLLARVHAQTESWQSVCTETEDTLGRSSALDSITQDKQSNGGCVSCCFSVSWLQARQTSHRRAKIFSLESLLELA